MSAEYADELKAEIERLRKQVKELDASDELRATALGGAANLVEQLQGRIAELEGVIESQGRDHDAATCTMGSLCPWCEIERLKKELTYSMMAASAEAERVAELERQIDEALAVLRLPGLDNNGGPADLAEEVRVWNGNLNRYMRDGHHITDAQLDAAWAKRVLIPSADNDDSANTYIPIKPLGIERCGGCEECEGDGWYWKEEK